MAGGEPQLLNATVRARARELEAMATTLDLSPWEVVEMARHDDAPRHADRAARDDGAPRARARRAS